jgi:hypothetical protein
MDGCLAKEDLVHLACFIRMVRSTTGRAQLHSRGDERYFDDGGRTGGAGGEAATYCSPAEQLSNSNVLPRCAFIWVKQSCQYRQVATGLRSSSTRFRP